MEKPESKKHITDSDLVDMVPRDSFVHLAKTSLDRNLYAKQNYAIGFNTGGRPDGIWFTKGNTWFEKLHNFNNPKYQLCCYVYQLSLDMDKILHITEENFDEFDKKYSSYWLNMDYFTLDFVDYTTGETINSEKKSELDFSKLRQRPGGIKETLLYNKIIFDNPHDALINCEFYRTCPDIQRFKYKDWCEISKSYHGVIIDWSINSRINRFIWYQSLDIPSGCVWDPLAITEVELLFNKSPSGEWIKH